jgi:aminopeptidase-like protein
MHLCNDRSRQHPGGEDVQLKEITTLIDAEVSPDRLLADVEAIQNIDRHFTYPKFMESARLTAEKLAQAGLESRVLEQPADGVSRMGDWTMPLAWDCREAVLELVAPDRVKGQVLCRRSEDPNAVAMWSAPTDQEGVTADVVGPVSFRPASAGGKAAFVIGPAGAEKPATDGDLAGKIVYTAGHARSLKRRLVRAKAVGVITSYSPSAAYQPQNRFWVNGWADDPGGWAFTAKDTPMWCFVLTPAQGKEFEALLAEGPVTARATVESRLYEGILPAATGLLRGETGEEILTLGHQFEIGADDNASGCAVMLEAARVLSRLVSEDKLPAPARSLRWLFISECYGSMAYAAMNPRQVRRTLAGMNLDCVGGDQRGTEMPLPVSLTPGANPSVADTLIRRLCGGYLWERDPYFSWFTTSFTSCDSSIGDPMIDIPVVYLGGKDRFWHSSGDTIDKIDPEAISRVAVLAASFAYFLGSAGSPEAEWLAEEAAADGRRRLARIGAAFAGKLRRTGASGRGRVLGLASEHLAYHREVGAARVRSAQKFASRTERREFRQALRPMVAGLKKQAKLEEAYLAKLAARLADEAGEPAPQPEEPTPPAWWAEAQEVIPVRKVFGALTLDEVPPAQRDGRSSPRWLDRLTNVLFRCDGRRTLAEACRLGFLDTGESQGGSEGWNFLEYFRFLERHGLVVLRRVKKKPALAGR